VTRQELLAQLLGNISDDYDKLAGSFFYDALMPAAIVLEGIYADIAKILPHAFAKTATGIYLDYKVAEQGLIRKEAAKAAGTVTVSGNNGAVIKVGDKVSSDTVTFTVTQSGTITNGSVTVPVECDMAGAVGNLPAGTINRFPVTLSGIISVTNTEPTSGGYDAETDDELRERYFEKVSRPLAGGNIYDYMLWAKEVGGVGEVKVIPLWNGNGSVKVMVINSNGTAADSSLITKVAANIEQKRPVGANVTVVSAEPLPINISVIIYIKEGYVLDDIKIGIQSAVSLYLKSIAFQQDYVSYAQIGSRVLIQDGVLDYQELLVNSGSGNVNVAENQVPVLGALEVSV